MNLRGVREAGAIFLAPDLRVHRALARCDCDRRATRRFCGGGHPVPVVRRFQLRRPATAAVSAWLLLKVFASGCTAMTGVEAVSNGVKAFREPTAKTAQRTLTVIIGLLIVMLAGIAYLVRAYGDRATDPGAPGYQSVLSMLRRRGRRTGNFLLLHDRRDPVWFWRFRRTPRSPIFRDCARSLSQDGFLPRSFGSRGRRLVYSQGIYVLSGLCRAAAGDLWRHHRPADSAVRGGRVPGVHAFASGNGRPLEAHRADRSACKASSSTERARVATGITVVVVLVAKFAEGAWMTLVLIAGLVSW